MEERSIVEAKKYDVKKITKGILLIGIGLGILNFGFSVMSDSFYIRHGLGYIITSAFPYFFLMAFVPFAVIAGLFYFFASKVSLTVTDKRIYGTAAFGKRVDLPIDMISAIGSFRLFRSVTVATASGKISFPMIKNMDEVFGTISEILIQRQDKQRDNTTPVKESSTVSADELKKFKDMLDSGIITQEEFDAKKKQLLGL